MIASSIVSPIIAREYMRYPKTAVAFTDKRTGLRQLSLGRKRYPHSDFWQAWAKGWFFDRSQRLNRQFCYPRRYPKKKRPPIRRSAHFTNDLYQKINGRSGRARTCDTR